MLLIGIIRTTRRSREGRHQGSRCAGLRVEYTNHLNRREKGEGRREKGEGRGEGRGERGEIITTAEILGTWKPCCYLREEERNKRDDVVIYLQVPSTRSPAHA